MIGAGIGEDCAVFSLGDGKMTAMSSNIGYWPGTDTAQFPLYRSVNALAAMGAEPVAVDVSVLLPKEAEEVFIKGMTAQIEERCALLKIQIAG